MIIMIYENYSIYNVYNHATCFKPLAFLLSSPPTLDQVNLNLLKIYNISNIF